MYKTMIDTMKQYVRESGKIELIAAVKFRESEVFSGKVAYRINYAYSSKATFELLGKFALSIIGGVEYNMSNLTFTKENCKPALKDVLLELILEKAVAEAKAFRSSYLIIETKDPKIVEAAMNFNFKVARYLMRNLAEETHLYRCAKKLALSYYSTQP